MNILKDVLPDAVLENILLDYLVQPKTYYIVKYREVVRELRMVINYNNIGDMQHYTDYYYQYFPLSKLKKVLKIKSKFPIADNMDKRLKLEELPYMVDASRQYFNFETGEMVYTNNRIYLPTGQIVQYTLSRMEKFDESRYDKFDYYLKMGKLNNLPKNYRTIPTENRPHLTDIHPDDLPTSASLWPSFYKLCKYDLKENVWRWGQNAVYYVYK